ncbi:hypothetical protein HanHA300_Chr17g0662931 [Helianthus annuus]|nr:hypothetical protein HanHA300_Chr17g0662931 [Helianthus annuus]
MKFKPVAPACDASIDKCPPASIALYCRHFEFSNLRHPFSIFVLNVLEYYCISFGQIHPQGLARVLHFEVLCRASGYDPTLLSFCRFFRLAKNGDWFTFETTQIVPFKLVWRHPDAVLNEPEPSASEINTCFLDTLRECPSRLRPFPEHLLVLLGLSKLWEKRDRDPVLMRDGQGMHLSCCSDDTSDVAFDDVAATPGEDAVVRGSEHRFEGSGYVNVPNVKGFTKAPGSKVIEVDVSKGKEKELVVSGKKKKELIKKGSTPTIQGSSVKSVESFEGPEAEKVYVPNWGVKALLAEDVTRFTKGMQEYEDASKKKASMAAMKKEVEGFSKKEEDWAKKVEELTRKHEIEFNSALGEVYTKLLNLGKYQGLIAGYKLHESGHPLEKSPLYRPEASEVFKGSVEQMERLTYPYVNQVAACFGNPPSVLQDLKPDGLNEKVYAEVLGSLSRKRSYSGDSEDTFSGEPNAPKDASLEGSAVGGDGGSKAKKSKKTKRAKGNGSGASKPSVDA